MMRRKTQRTQSDIEDPNADQQQQYTKTPYPKPRTQNTKREQFFYLGLILVQAIVILFLIHRQFPSSNDEVQVILYDGNTRVFHGGSPVGKQTGSCFCGKDDYCMCNPSLAIDLILVDHTDEYVYLVRRKDTNQLATMGGFVNIGESTEETVKRELMEETSITLEEKPILFGVYSDPKRDARRHTASAIYVARVPENVHPRAGSDVKSVEKLSWVDVLEGGNSFFADHETILRDYYERSLGGEKGGGGVDIGWDKIKRSLCAA